MKTRVGMLCSVLLFSACSGNRHGRDTLVIGISGSLNLGANNPVMIQRNSNVWEALTQLDDSLTPRPQLAESWDVSPDGKQWVFHLSRNIQFQDGTPLTAPLVVANIERLKTHPELDYYSTFAHLASVAARDESSIELRFSRPLVDLPAKVGHYFAGIFSLAAIGPDGKLKSPIGSGPYSFVESRIGQYDLVRSFDRFHGGRPSFRQVEFRIIPDPAVRVMSLLRGDIDIIAHHGGVPVSYVPMLKGKPDIVVASQDVAITHYLLFNCKRKPFSDRDCRDKFNRLLDRDGMASMILRGSGTAAHDFMIPSAARWNRNRFSPSPETGVRACRSPEPLVLLLSQSDISSWGYRYVADYLADYFNRAGVAIRVESLEAGAWQKATQQGQFDLTLYPLSVPTGTPELLIRRLAFSKGMRVRAIGNSTGYASPELDSLFEEAVGAPNLGAQEARFNTILDLLAREQPFVPLYHERYYYAHRRGLTGVRVDPFLKLDLGAIQWGNAEQ
jgi:peptide/nickel transport system substrate-binding protein